MATAARGRQSRGNDRGQWVVEDPRVTIERASLSCALRDSRHHADSRSLAKRQKKRHLPNSARKLEIGCDPGQDGPVSKVCWAQWPARSSAAATEGSWRWLMEGERNVALGEFQFQCDRWGSVCGLAWHVLRLELWRQGSLLEGARAIQKLNSGRLRKRLETVALLHAASGTQFTLPTSRQVCTCAVRRMRLLSAQPHRHGEACGGMISLTKRSLEG
jgi:hypothetical protein